MNDYRLLLSVREGLGTITVNGVAPLEYYTEGDTLTIAISPESGFHTAKWYSSPGNSLISSALSFSFTMPSNDVKMYVVLTGQNTPVNDYGLKYEGGYATNYGGNVWNLQIFRTGYSGAITPLQINDITYNWGNTGNDPLETIIGSSVDFTIAGETGDFNEFLVGGNRTWKVVLNQIGANNDITDWNGVNVTNYYKSVAYGNGLFVATFGPFRAYSLDGITWNESIPVGWQANAITYGNGLFVAVGYAVVSGTPTAFAFTSPDGLNWTSRTPASNINWVNVAYGNGLFVAVASNGVSNRIMTSPDGITWTSRDSGINPDFSAVVYGNGIWVAVSTASTGGSVFTSYDGIDWSEQSQVLVEYSIAYGNGLFTTGNYYSTDGINWNVTSFGTLAKGITYGNGYFVAITDGGTNRVLYSTDAISWTSIQAASNATFKAIAFGENTFVAVADGGTTNRINYLVFEGLQSFFTGYIAPDFITSQFKSGIKLFEFTAIDGLKGLDSIRSNFSSWPDPRTQAISAIIGALNQSFVDKRQVFVGCEIHETRMDSDISVFRQFNVPLNAIYTDGETAKFSNGVRIENEQLYLKDTIERMVNPFLCRVFLWKDKFYVIRLNEFIKTDYKAYIFNPDTSIEAIQNIINGDDINADINRPEETARRVFTEFNAFLNLGILDQDSQGGVFDAKFEEPEWNYNSSASPYPNIYQLKLWDYVNAIPSGQPSSVPSGNTALVQYVSDGSGEYVQIWTTTTTDGVDDPNLSYISANTNSTGGAIVIAQETANTISLTFEYMVERVGSAFSVTPPAGTHAVGLMVKIGDQYLFRDTTTTFDWTATPTVMEFAVTTGSVWNSIAINNVLVPTDGEVEIRLHQLICNSGTANRYVIRYDNISLKIEKTAGLSLSKLGVKAVTGSPYANVHPDYNTHIGDAITSNSASAIRLLTAGEPVSEGWSRDGVEDLPLLDIIVQELANLKGRTNYRVLATLERRPIDPFRAFLFNGRYWALVSYQLNCRTGTAQIELYDLGIEPTT
jgi:hypothetical protein